MDAAPKETVTADLEKCVGAVLSEANVSWALSRRYSGEGAHDDAIRVARLSEINDDNWTRDIAIGEAILRRFENDFDALIGVPQNRQGRCPFERSESLPGNRLGVYQGAVRSQELGARGRQSLFCVSPSWGR